MALELLKITGSQPYYLNNASTAEELTIALEDFMRTGTQIIFQHDGDDCILTSYEYNTDENKVIAYFVTPKKKLLKVDIGAGWDLVITESEFTPETDTTLTQSGKPADAKAVGTALGNKANKTDLNNYASKTELNSYATKNELNSYATKTYVDNAVANSGGGIGEDVLAMLAQAGDTLNKVSSKATGVEVWVVIEKYPEPERINMAWQATQQGMPFDIELVETLPQTPIISTEEACYLYVVNSTGIAYIYDGTRFLSLGDSFYGTPNHGWTTDINAETVGGFYCVRTNNFATEEYVNKAIANNGGGGGNTGGGGASGGGNVDYGAEIFVTLVDDGVVHKLPAAIFLKSVLSLDLNVNVQIVSTTPTNMPASDLTQGGTVDVCVLESTGVAYGNLGYGTMELGVSVFQAAGYDKGWSQGAGEEMGIYTIKTLKKYDGVTQFIPISIGSLDYTQQNLLPEVANSIKLNFKNTVLHIIYGTNNYYLYPSQEVGKDYIYTGLVCTMNVPQCFKGLVRDDGTGTFGFELEKYSLTTRT